MNFKIVHDFALHFEGVTNNGMKGEFDCSSQRCFKFYDQKISSGIGEELNQFDRFGVDLREGIMALAPRKVGD